VGRIANLRRIEIRLPPAPKKSNRNKEMQQCPNSAFTQYLNVE